MKLVDAPKSYAADAAWRSGPRHIHEQLRDRLLDAIVRPGTAGDQVPAERELAKKFGVSTMTISRALKTLQDEGYVERLPGKGTFLRALPSPALTGHRQSPPRAITTLPWERTAPAQMTALNTWIITNLSEDPRERLDHQWTHRSATAMERAIQSAGGRTTLIDFGAGRELHPYATVEEAIDAGVNSVALFCGINQNANYSSLIHQLIRCRIHRPERLNVVEISTGSEASWPMDCVGYDDEWGVFLAVEHLVSLGHTKIAFAGKIDKPWVQKRVAAYRTALAASGLSFEAVGSGRVLYEGVSQSNIDWDSVGAEVADAYMASSECREATAVIALNDMTAICLQYAAHNAGLRLPADLSIVGFDDIRQAATSGLTTVHPPIEESGEMAAKLLASRASSPFPAGRELIVLNPSLIVRSSSTTPRTG